MHRSIDRSSTTDRSIDRLIEPARSIVRSFAGIDRSIDPLNELYRSTSIARYRSIGSDRWILDRAMNASINRSDRPANPKLQPSIARSLDRSADRSVDHIDSIDRKRSIAECSIARSVRSDDRSVVGRRSTELVINRSTDVRVGRLDWRCGGGNLPAPHRQPSQAARGEISVQ